MPSDTCIWNPVMPLFSFTIFSKVLSDMVKRAWPPNIALIMGFFSLAQWRMKSPFSLMARSHFSSPSRSLTS